MNGYRKGRALFRSMRQLGWQTNHYRHPVPKLGISGAVLPVSRYNFMIYPKTIVPSHEDQSTGRDPDIQPPPPPHQYEAAPAINTHTNILAEKFYVEARLTFHRRNRPELHQNIQLVPSSKHTPSVIMSRFLGGTTSGRRQIASLDVTVEECCTNATHIKPESCKVYVYWPRTTEDKHNKTRNVRTT